METKFFSVTQINSYIKEIMEEDVLLSDLFIQGEISNFKAHFSGHLYFSLKDESASISCVMFQNSAKALKFAPEDGMRVMIYGRVGVYEKTGKYQIYAEVMEQKGLGELYMRFEALKLSLSQKGYFDQANKKSIPEDPKCVAVITSPTGAAVRDIIQVSKSRNPGVELVIIPCLVQGDTAAASIAEAINTANAWGKADVIIVGRGGGSAEDLWAFNEEAAAEAIFKSKIPVISAVGHETDYSIADFAADKRAETPTAAAVLAVPDITIQKRRHKALIIRMEGAMLRLLDLSRERVRNTARYSSLSAFESRLSNCRKGIDSLNTQLKKNMELKLSYKANALSVLSGRLTKASPLDIMGRGYSMVTKGGKRIKSVNDVESGDAVDIALPDGSLSAKVENKNRSLE